MAEVNAVLRTGAEPTAIKACCALAYESEWARLLLGDSFHPGGLALTEHLGRALGLSAQMRVLDVASGKGASAVHLAQVFGCHVLGIDYGDESVAAARVAAQSAGVDHLVQFAQGDAEALPCGAEEFDAVLCECAFCTFPDKDIAAREFARVLKPGSKVGLTDLTRAGETPQELQGLLAWVACIADALPLGGYERHLLAGGMTPTIIEEHNDALAQMVRDVRTRLLAAELLVKLKQIALPFADFDQAKTLALAATHAVQRGVFGYALLVATKPGEGE
jgi:arsenite methyltransferase